MTAALLTPADAADYLGCKESRIRRLAHSGVLPYRRDGKFLRFTKADLDSYVEAIAVAAAPTGLVRTRQRRRRTA